MLSCRRLWEHPLVRILRLIQIAIITRLYSSSYIRKSCKTRINYPLGIIIAICLLAGIWPWIPKWHHYCIRVPLINFSSPDKCQFFITVVNFCLCSCQFAIECNIKVVTESSMLISLSLNEESAIMIPIIFPLITTVWSLRFHSQCMSIFNATFSYNWERESNDDHCCMHI